MATSPTSLRGRPVSQKQWGRVESDMDTLFLLFSGLWIFFVQGGFALFETGIIRKKSIIPSLLKNVLDSLVGAFAYWSVGFAFAYGKTSDGGKGNPFIGDDHFFLYNYENFAFWWYQFAFAATCSTIVSGAVAERVSFEAYLFYSFFLTAFVYPVATHWAWCSGGWLWDWKFIDFAGGVVVHALGGIAALVGCILVGPREGRFTPSGEVVRMPIYSLTFVTLGFFILWTGFLAFVSSSTLRISRGAAEFVSRSLINSVLSGCAGGLTTLFVTKLIRKKWCLIPTMNAILAGTVAICNSAHVVEPWAAFVIGMLGGLAFCYISHILVKFQIDDPSDAIGVHLGGGTVSMLGVSLFSRKELVEKYYDSSWDYGVFYGGNPKILGVHLAGYLAVIAWSGTLISLSFFIMKKFGWLRLKPDKEDHADITM